jgi:predicted DNA-binding protein with PD1-like motif
MFNARKRPAFVRCLLALSLFMGVGACSSVPTKPETFVVRLKPGQELVRELRELAEREQLRAASVVSAVGSLTDVALRMANKEETTRFSGRFEVVALSGYLAAGEFHRAHGGEWRRRRAHDQGGHVMEGNRVYTTLVVAVQEHPHLVYRRAFDPAWGYPELVIDRR